MSRDNTSPTRLLWVLLMLAAVALMAAALLTVSTLLKTATHQGTLIQ
jgi:flagellar basal body-associated protein FliL